MTDSWMNLTRPHISCDRRIKSKEDIVNSTYLCPIYPVSMPICSNLERPCYISSPDLAWVPGMFLQGLWNKIPHTREVTRWVVSAEVYKATLGSLCNVRGVGIWQWQGMLQYFASMSVSGNISVMATHGLSFNSSARVFPHFWEGLEADRKQELKAEHAWQ